MTLPISPKQASLAAGKAIPDFVIEAFNELIGENMRDGVARVDIPAAFKRVAKKAREQGFNYSTDQIEAKHWLDVEPLYEARGWSVSFINPAFNEQGEQVMVFKARR